ncbi:MAG: VWA domain-containing protein [Acidimicrobiia bacterium]|nr:VWA domain-containing protein [Acidimicrobiia bacterium]
MAQDDGGILVLSAFMLVVLFALAAFAIDISLQSSDRQSLWNSTDAAALAGAALLPDGVAAEASAVDIALANDPDLAGDVATAFRCLVASNSTGTGPRIGEVPDVCNPGADIGASDWNCADGVCSAVCEPSQGDTCNTIVLGTQKTTDFAFAPVIGQDSTDTGLISAACRGTCGSGLTGPVDLVIVIDRSGSMTSADMDNVENAALAMLNFFDPAIQKVGLAVLPPAQKADECVLEDADPTQWSNGRWLIVPLSSDYKDNPNLDVNGDFVPDLDSNSELVNRIICSTDEGWTDLGSPIRDASATTTEVGDDALWELSNGTEARAGVRKGILLLSDGAANQPATVTDPCLFARNQAVFAQNQGVEIFTIGFGVDTRSATCQQDEAAPYGTSVIPPDGAPVTRLLADMATDSNDNCTVATTDFENTDGDHFFCLPKTEDLTTVFLAIATQLAQGSRLVQLPPEG